MSNNPEIERPATAAEVRQSYKASGHLVRISRDGHVIYRENGKGPWLEGRWVEEYRISLAYGVRC